LRFSFIQLNLSRIAFDNQNTTTLKKILRYFCMGFTVIKTHLKNINIDYKFPRFSLFSWTYRNCIRQSKTQQTMKDLRYFCMGFTCPSKTHLKKYQISINKFRDFLLFSWTYRELHSTSKLQQTMKRFWDIFAWDLVTSKTHLKKYPMSIKQIFEIFFYSVELIANCIRQSKTTTNYWKDFEIFLHGI